MEATWYYLRGNDAVGPVDEAALAQLLCVGTITTTASVRAEAESSWSRLKDRLPELGEEPPLPADFNAGAVRAPPGTRWTDTAPHPWRRYFARLVDDLVVSAICFWLVLAGLEVIAPAAAADLVRFQSDPGGRLVIGWLALILIIPANALILGSTGLSLGKWLFGVKIVRPNGAPIGVRAAFWREANVWGAGLACGIPIVYLFTTWTAFKALNEQGHAPWDPPDERIAVHRRFGILQLLLIAATVPSFLLLFAMLSQANG
jgi:uncharacterized RDD family membrane protein YckC